MNPPTCLKHRVSKLRKGIFENCRWCVQKHLADRIFATWLSSQMMERSGSERIEEGKTQPDFWYHNGCLQKLPITPTHHKNWPQKKQSQHLHVMTAGGLLMSLALSGVKQYWVLHPPVIAGLYDLLTGMSHPVECSTCKSFCWLLYTLVDHFWLMFEATISKLRPSFGFPSSWV